MWVKWAGWRWGMFYKMAELITTLLPKVVALPPAVQPCHLFTCQLWYLSHPFSELFWVITSAEIFLGRWRGFFWLSNWIVSRQGGWTWGLVWKKGQDYLPSGERLTASFGGCVWVSQLSWIIGPCSHVFCVEAFFIFARFSSAWLKLCDYFSVFLGWSSFHCC